MYILYLVHETLCSGKLSKNPVLCISVSYRTLNGSFCPAMWYEKLSHSHDSWCWQLCDMEHLHAYSMLGTMVNGTSLSRALAFSRSHSSNLDTGSLNFKHDEEKFIHLLIYKSFIWNKIIIFKFNNTCLLNDKFVTLCSHALQKILMVHIYFTFRLWPRVIWTQAINSFCIAWTGDTH